MRAISAVLSLVIGVYVVFTTTLMVIHGWSAIPYWDQWNELIFSAKQLFSPWIYSQHNEHRILFPRLVFAIDTFAFAENNKFNFFSNLALPLTLAGMIIGLAHRHVSRSIAETLWMAGLILAMLFSAMQFANFLWGFQVQHFAVELAAAASMACVAQGRSEFADPSCRNRFLRNRRLFTCKRRSRYHSLQFLWLCGRDALKTQIGMLAIASAVLLASYTPRLRLTDPGTPIRA